MATRGRIDLRLASRILLLQLVVVTLTLIVAFGLFAEFNRHRLDLRARDGYRPRRGLVADRA